MVAFVRVGGRKLPVFAKIAYIVVLVRLLLFFFCVAYLIVTQVLGVCQPFRGMRAHTVSKHGLLYFET